MGKDGVTDDRLLDLIAAAFRRKGMLFPETEEEVKAAEEELARLEAAGELPPLPESLKEPPWHLLEGMTMAQDWPGYAINTDMGFQEYVAKLVNGLRALAQKQEQPEDRQRLEEITDELEGGTLDQVTIAWAAYLESQKKPPEDPVITNVNYLLRRVLRQQGEHDKTINRILQIVEGLAQRRR